MPGDEPRPQVSLWTCWALKWLLKNTVSEGIQRHIKVKELSNAGISKPNFCREDAKTQKD